MRKILKERLHGIIVTMEEAHLILRNEHKLLTQDSLFDILISCQEAAISIGESIEKSEGPEHEVIKELEDYCELVYLANQAYLEDQTDFFNKNDKALQLIKKIDLDIVHKIHLTYDIVFLPYKASMWDSLESIWMEATNDSNCNCYVIPIPYYDLDATGKVKETHYEVDLFPDYVPITAYTEYDLKENHPDVIYFHNPYDKFNLVTSVPMYFYSSELKKNTDTLVYVPYFITGGSMAEHHIELPAYYNVDYIVIQSEMVKNCFKNETIRNKMIATGSPKVDRMLRLNNNKPSIPTKWNIKAINKKVILYNTSITGYLEGRITAISKMKYVFSCFKSYKDVILLWRPHPLTEASLYAVSSSLYRGYMELKQEFIQNGIGILDETPDIETAVAYSDAYIGEETSSVVHLFGVTGKPIFILDMKLVQKNNRDELSSVMFFGFHIKNNYLWFPSGEYNAICKMDIETGMVELFQKIPFESTDEVRLYNEILNMDNRLFLIPLCGVSFVEYNIDNNEMLQTRISEPGACCFMNAVYYKDNIFMLPGYYKGIICYNIRNKEIYHYDKYIEEISKYIDCRNDIQFFGAEVYDDVVYMAAATANLVMEFNLSTRSHKIHFVGDKGDNFWGITVVGDDCWLISNTGCKIIKWNRKTNVTTEYTDFPEGFKGTTNCFIKIISFQGYLLIFPKTANMILRIDTKSGEMSEFKLNLPYEEGNRQSGYYEWPSNYYFVKKLDTGRIAALTAYNRSLLIIDPEKTTYKIIPCRLNNTEMVNLVKLGFREYQDDLPYACYETKYRQLDMFIDYVKESGAHDDIKQRTFYADAVANMDETCGKKTHHYIMEMIMHD